MLGFQPPPAACGVYCPPCAALRPAASPYQCPHHNGYKTKTQAATWSARPGTAGHPPPAGLHAARQPAARPSAQIVSRTAARCCSLLHSAGAAGCYRKPAASARTLGRRCCWPLPLPPLQRRLRHCSHRCTAAAAPCSQDSCAAATAAAHRMVVVLLLPPALLQRRPRGSCCVCPPAS